MKKYSKPEIEVVVFESADVLMASGEQPTTIAEENLKGNNFGDVYGVNN